MDDDQLHALLGLTRFDSQDASPQASGWRSLLPRFGRGPVRRAEQTRGYNPFYAEYEQTGDFGAYLRQVDVAWLRAQHACRYDLEVRYALLHASVNSFAANLPPRLLRTLVERGVWSLPNARELAAKIPDPSRRALALVELADSNNTFEDALAAADLITDAPTRTDTFIQLAARVPDECVERASRAAVEAASSIPIEDVQSERLAAVARQLPAQWLPIVQAQAEKMTNEVSRSRALVGVAAQLASLGRHAESLEVARNIPYETARSEALGELAAHVPEAAWRQGLERARSLPLGNSRTSALVPYAACAARLGHLDEALSMARTMDSDLARAAALILIGPHLTPQFRERALSIARECADALSRAQALAGLVREGPDGDVLIREALEENARVRVPEYRAAALKTLAPKLPAGLLGAAAAQARQLPDERPRAEMLELLARRQAQLGAYAGALETIRHLPDEEVLSRGVEQLAAVPELPESLLMQLLEVAQNLTQDVPRRSALGAVGVRLAAHPLAQALRAFRNLADADARQQARSALFPYLPAEFREKDFNAALALEDPDTRARTLEYLLPYLTDNLLRRAIAAGAAIKDAEVRASFNSACVQRLAAVGQVAEAEKLLNETHGGAWREAAVVLVPAMIRQRRTRAALDLMVVIQHPATVVRALVAAVADLPDAAVETLLAQVRNFGSEYDESKGEGLAALATRLAEPKRATVVEQALTAARRAYLTRERGVDPDEVHARALSRLIRWLPDEAIQAEALNAVRGIRDDAARARALERLIPVLDEVSLDKALELVRSVGDPGRVAASWITLVRAAPNRREWLAHAMAAVDGITDASARAEALAQLTAALLNAPSDELRMHYHKALPVLATRSRREVLTQLVTVAPVIYALGGESAVREVESAINDVGIWWP